MLLLYQLQGMPNYLATCLLLLLQREEIEKKPTWFTWVNGQHLGDYRLPGGKRQAYDTDICVQGGQGFKVALVLEIVLSIDLLPTWVELGPAEDLLAWWKEYYSSFDGPISTPGQLQIHSEQPHWQRCMEAQRIWGELLTKACRDMRTIGFGTIPTRPFVSWFWLGSWC